MKRRGVEGSAPHKKKRILRRAASRLAQNDIKGSYFCLSFRVTLSEVEGGIEGSVLQDADPSTRLRLAQDDKRKFVGAQDDRVR